MTVNPIFAIISLGISALIAYGLHENSNQNQILLAVVSGVFLLSTLGIAIALKLKNRDVTWNMRIVATIFFVIALVTNLIFSFLNFSVPSYIIINGILYLIFVLICYGIGRIKMKGD